MNLEERIAIELVAFDLKLSVTYIKGKWEEYKEDTKNLYRIEAREIIRIITEDSRYR